MHSQKIGTDAKMVVLCLIWCVGGMAVAVSASTCLFLVEKLLDDRLNQANQSFLRQPEYLLHVD